MGSPSTMSGVSFNLLYAESETTFIVSVLKLQIDSETWPFVGILRCFRSIVPIQVVRTGTKMYTGSSFLYFASE